MNYEDMDVLFTGEKLEEAEIPEEVFDEIAGDYDDE
jgi:hypothetical protein